MGNQRKGGLPPGMDGPGMYNPNPPMGQQLPFGGVGQPGQPPQGPAWAQRGGFGFPAAQASPMATTKFGGPQQMFGGSAKGGGPQINPARPFPPVFSQSGARTPQQPQPRAMQYGMPGRRFGGP